MKVSNGWGWVNERCRYEGICLDGEGTQKEAGSGPIYFDSASSVVFNSSLDEGGVGKPVSRGGVGALATFTI
jgi:hypothetical protein